MNKVIAGAEDHTQELAQLLNIDVNDKAQNTFIYAMEYMKYGNMNVNLLPALCVVHLCRPQTLGQTRKKKCKTHMAGALVLTETVTVGSSSRNILTQGAAQKPGALARVSLPLQSVRWTGVWYVSAPCVLSREHVVLTGKDGWDDNDDPTTQRIPTQEEFVPRDDAGRDLKTHEGLIDFDINDRNVMIGIVPPGDMNRNGVQEHSHDDVPVFKVGDLGIVRAIRGYHRDSMLTLSACRVLGNQWANTPEQFSQAWNFYGETDADMMNADDNAAGKYDWWTNLWQVARLMAIMVRHILPLA